MVVLRKEAEIFIVICLPSCSPSNSGRSLAGPVERSSAARLWGHYKGQGKGFDLYSQSTGETVKVCKQGVCAGWICLRVCVCMCVSSCLRDRWMEREKTVKDDPTCCVFFGCWEKSLHRRVSVNTARCPSPRWREGEVSLFLPRSYLSIRSLPSQLQSRQCIWGKYLWNARLGDQDVFCI